MNFPTPRHRHGPSIRPNPANDTLRVRQNEPVAQRGQRLFSPRSEVAKIVARKRRDQITAVLRDTNCGPCLTDDAVLYVAEIVPHIAIACGQNGFWYALSEWVKTNTPRIPRAAVDEVANGILLDPPRYNSAATGRRLGVAIKQYDRLGLTLIWPAGWSRKKLDEHLRVRRNTTVKGKRHATGESKTRRELSIAQLKPWTLPGAPCRSRARFYDMSKADREALVARARAEASVIP